ncbi:MAG: hypothetical protein ACM31C_11830 [Acidobacteriota bacterium]
MRIALVLALLAGACADDSCPAPSRPAYTCDPIPAGSSGCVGGCYVSGGPPATDHDKTFPIGCDTTLAYCSRRYQGEAQVCTCMPTNDGIVWVPLL